MSWLSSISLRPAAQVVRFTTVNCLPALLLPLLSIWPTAAAQESYNLATGSPSYPTTAGAYQRTFRGGNTDWAVTKLSPSGALLASTFIGGSAGENADGVYADASGNVFVTGETQSTDFPVTPNAYQSSSRGSSEAVLVRLSADFSKLQYCTYMGGAANDNGRSGYLGADGSLYLTGSADGPGWPVKNALQSTFAGGGGSYANGDCILAKFTPASMITVDAAITYQTITGWEAVAFALEPGNPAFANFKDELFDLVVNDLGKKEFATEGTEFTEK